MSEHNILVVEPDRELAARVLSILAQSGYSGQAVGSCVDAVEPLISQPFSAVLIGFGQAAGEVAELVGCAHGLDGVRVFSYAGEPGLPVDDVLPRDFGAAELRNALNSAPAAPKQATHLAVFEPEQFAEQCAEETSLMIEIIDLFEAERHSQAGEMKDALNRDDFDRLSRLAHTLKGSVGALHAPAARETCQSMELAAKAGDPVLCGRLLMQLEGNLNDLAAPLARFRQACVEAG